MNDYIKQIFALFAQITLNNDQKLRLDISECNGNMMMHWYIGQHHDVRTDGDLFDWLWIGDDFDEDKAVLWIAELTAIAYPKDEESEPAEESRAQIASRENAIMDKQERLK